MEYYTNGDTAWSRAHGLSGSMPMASGHGIGADGSGNVYVTGDAGTMDGIFDYLTIKYTASGDTAWTAAATTASPSFGAPVTGSIPPDANSGPSDSGCSRRRSGRSGVTD